jgi:hypothetical protein
LAFSKKKSGSEKRKRNPIIGFRATDEERAQIKANAARAGYTVSSYVRAQSLAKPTTRAVRRPPIETAQLAQLLGQLGAASGSIAAITEGQGNGCAVSPALADEALTAFREAAKAIMHTLGKRAYDH